MKILIAFLLFLAATVTATSNVSTLAVTDVRQSQEQVALDIQNTGTAAVTKIEAKACMADGTDCFTVYFTGQFPPNATTWSNTFYFSRVPATITLTAIVQ